MTKDFEGSIVLGFGDVVQFHRDADTEDKMWVDPSVVLQVSGRWLRVSRIQNIGERALLGLSSKEWGIVRLAPDTAPWTLATVVNAQAEFATRIPIDADETVVGQKQQARSAVAARLTELYDPLAAMPPSEFVFSAQRPGET